MTKDRMLCRAALAAAMTIVLAGCGDNAGEPLGYAPEGQEGSAILLVSAQPAAADSSSLFLLATVLSPPPANGFRFYLNPASHGYRPATDAPIPPFVTLNSGWSVYQAGINGYDPAVTSEVVARGARDGYESAAAQLTNTAFVPAAAVLDLVRLADVGLGLPEDSTTVGARPTLTWEAVPGATRYVLQITSASGTIEYVALTTTNSHQIGVGPGVILQTTTLRNAALYRWSVQAYNAGSRQTGLSREDRAFFVFNPPTP